MKKLLKLPNLLYIVAVAISFIQTDYELQNPAAYIVVLTLFEAAFIVGLFKGEDKARTDMFSIIFAIAILWDVEAKFIKSLHYTVFPPPENVFYIFTTDYQKMIEGFFHSMGLIITGVGLGMFFGVFLGLLIGYSDTARKSLSPIINVIAAIPALVYAPYVVAVAPDFKSASVITIFLGIFFPTLMNMIGNVAAVDKKLIDSARSLNLSSFDMLFKVLLPDCAIPIITSLRIRISSRTIEQ